MKGLLPVLMMLPVLLLGGFQTNSREYNDRGAFDPMARSLNDKSYGYQIVKDVTGSAPTKLIERFEVRPGDCTAQGGWDDCGADRERSESMQLNRDISIGTTEWYGWQIYVPKEHRDIFPAKVFMGQFFPKGPKPDWMFVNHALLLVQPRPHPFPI